MTLYVTTVGGSNVSEKTCYICHLCLPWIFWVKLEILIVMPIYSQPNCKNIRQKTLFHTLWLNNLHSYEYVSSLNQYLVITESNTKLIITVNNAII